GMNGGDSVGAVRTNHRKVSHPHAPSRPLLYQADALNARIVPGISAPHIVEKAAIDFVNDLQLARDEHFEQWDGPLLQGFGQQRVVGVSKRLLGDTPGFITSQASLIEQDSHELCDGKRRVSVVHLNGDTLGKRRPVRSLASETGYDVLKRTAHQKILL